jgi:hypothetical protein
MLFPPAGVAMIFDRMLAKCTRDQWEVGDLDWSRTPPELSEEQERAVVQYFTDMAGIERLAGAMFEEQRRKVEDPVLEQIFASLERDEIRHAHAAQMLADFYDVHHYTHYQMNPALVRFTPHFIKLIRHLSPDIANAYVTSGELILDVALLRSLDDYVGDAMSAEAMERINRDESRHIAVDFHMVEYYCSAAYQDLLRDQPKRPLRERMRAYRALGMVLWNAKPFFRDVFFTPLDITDPSGRRTREAFKRIQLLSRKPDVRARPFMRFMTGAHDVYLHPVGRFVAGRLLERLLGVDPRALDILFTEEDARRAWSMSFDDLATDALGAKFATA